MNLNQPARILVVDDEGVTRVSLADALRLEGYEVDTAASGEEALSLFQKRGPFDLIVLDLKMPGIDGLEVAESITTTSPDTVIILLTAFGTMETAIEAIRTGTHDYLLKPCPIPEILRSVSKGLAKRRQAHRRRQLVEQLREAVSQLDGIESAKAADRVVPAEPERFLEIRDVLLDRQKHTALLDGEPLDLTPTEFKVLSCLMERPDEVWSPKQLVRRARGYEADTQGARAIIRVHIRRLRKKLEVDPSRPTYILNVRGVGYLFASTPRSSD
jgi:two-component system KDP operon response regulator KdpE